MSGVKVELRGTGEALNDITRQLELIGERTEQEIHDFAIGVHRRAVEGIQSGGSGITYEKFDPHRFHQASARGEYPASDTGRLASSVGLDLQKNKAAVFSNLRYARELEIRDPYRGGRPWLTRAWNEERAHRGW